MLRDLVGGKQKAQIIIIEDQCGTSGIGLLKTFLVELAKRHASVHLILLEYDKEALLSSLPSPTVGVLEVHNVAQDPLGWHNPDNTLTMNMDFVEHIIESSAGRGDQCAVVFDSLSALMCHRTAAFTCQTLQRLILRTKNASRASRVEQVVAMVHKDLHGDSALDMLRHTASAVVSLAPPVTPTYQASSHTVHKNLSGKVSRLKEQFRVGKDFSSVDTQDILTFNDHVVTGKAPDPAANLTFNLTLTDAEKDARSKVELPYMYDKQRQEAVLEKSVGSGKIFYQPDEADDFDEEDPDDDLDI